jgi:DNA-directed RNA polymerase subunit K/omega
MDIKKLDAPTTTITRDLIELEKTTGNIYESIAIISKRAEQISVQLKEELTEKINEFSSNLDSLDEIFENREQIELSKYYEKLPKPTLLAIQEFIEGKTYFRKPEEGELN